jgi:predicted component of type VI protein secretion system
VVDDQGLEVSYTSLKPSKERRFSDIILVQYSKNTQKIGFLALFRNTSERCFFLVQRARTLVWSLKPSKERRFSDIIPSIPQTFLK